MQPRPIVSLAFLAATALACGGVAAATDATNVDGTTTQQGASTPTGSGVPAVFSHFSSSVSISRDGDYIVLKATGVPDHKSPYFAQNDSRYEAYSGSNARFSSNGFTIQAQQYTFRIPVAPKAASTHAATPLGPIGVAVNGVPLFNQYNGQNRPLTVEINSFDQYNGHPQQMGAYHYHVEPLYITKTQGSSALIGFLLDGFPVYGPVENGKRITDADLDELHGHFGVTADYPGGIYHYHVTAEDPYINGAGFYGTPGTIGR